MTGNICVSKYPTEEGKLYRSCEGIIYAILDSGITALGCDLKNTGIISPVDSVPLKSLVHQGVKIDDKLAKRHKSNGGLKAIKLIVNKKFVRFMVQPSSLVNIILNYISKNNSEKKFNLGLLPNKFEKNIGFLSKLNEKREKFKKMRLHNRSLITGLKFQHMDEIAQQKHRHLREISQMESDHSEAAKLLRMTTNKEEVKMTFLINFLEILTPGSS